MKGKHSISTTDGGSSNSSRPQAKLTNFFIIPKNTKKKHEEYNKLLLTLLACEYLEKNDHCVKMGLHITIQLPEMTTPIQVIPQSTNLFENKKLSPKVETIIRSAIINLSDEVLQNSPQDWTDKLYVLKTHIEGLKRTLGYLIQILDPKIYSEWLSSQAIEYMCHINTNTACNTYHDTAEHHFYLTKNHKIKVHLYLAPYSTPSVNTNVPTSIETANLSLEKENLLLKKRIEKLENYLVQLRKKKA